MKGNDNAYYLHIVLFLKSVGLIYLVLAYNIYNILRFYYLRGKLLP